MAKFIIAKDHNQVGEIGAQIISDQIKLKPASVLGLATGSTPIPLYQQLVRLYQQGDLDFASVKSFNLDEYAGLSADHPQSYHAFMAENLFSRINIAKENIHILDGLAQDPAQQCRSFEEEIKKAGGIDLQLLGIGNNGHIGFNEPASVFICDTHVVDLTDSTREANRRFFSSLEEVPTQALTMGIGTIMAARKILLVLNGQNKAAAIEKAFLNDIDPQVPVSILQLHPDVTVVGDEAALGGLKRQAPLLFTSS
jgi:glucosamine-6-phosphate deaminase